MTFSSRPQAVGVLVDKWKSLSLEELTSFWLGAEDIRSVDPQSMVDDDFWNTDLALEVAKALEDAEANGWVHGYWAKPRNVVRDAVRDDVEIVSLMSGLYPVFRAAEESILAAISADGWVAIRSERACMRNHDYAGIAAATERLSLPDALRYRTTGFVVEAALALVTWDLVTPDGTYMPEMRDLLYEPWRQAMERFGSAT